MHTRTFKRHGTFGITLAGIALVAFTHVAHAESVYKCRAADGAIAFQDRPCAGTRTESVVEILPAPPSQPSPDYGRAPSRQDRDAGAHGASSRHAATKPSRDALSYACHAADGELFYRHGACPKQVSTQGNGPASGSHGRSAKASQGIGVSAEAMPRAEVCRALASAGSIGRAGHERDERISTYERNLGRDPCRYF